LGAGQQSRDVQAGGGRRPPDCGWARGVTRGDSVRTHAGGSAGRYCLEDEPEGPWREATSGWEVADRIT
jgi:hypothetical protein